MYDCCLHAAARSDYPPTLRQLQRRECGREGQSTRTALAVNGSLRNETEGLGPLPLRPEYISQSSMWDVVPAFHHAILAQ